MKGFLALLSTIVLLGAACSGDESSSSASSSTSAPVPGGATGCGTATDTAAGTQRFTVNYDGVDREVERTVPHRAQDDVGFLNELVDDTVAELCIDPDRVFVAGNSNGAAMSVTLACEGGSRYAAMAPVWASTSQVSANLRHRPRSSRSTVTLTRSSPTKAGVRPVTVLGGGHTWPGMLNYVDPEALAKLGANNALVELDGLDLGKIVGHMTVNVEATSAILDFFDAHPRVG